MRAIDGALGQSGVSLAAAGAAVMTILCVGLLASYVGSVLVYKIWYVATAAACAVAFLLAVATAIRVDGLGSALAPILVYFGYLAASAVWATDPMLTLTWVAIDSIQIPVVGLFFLWALNSSPRQLCWSLVALVYLCIPITIALQILDPDAQRFGYRALAVVPMVVPFCWVLWRRERSLLALAALAAILAMLLVSRSRAPLAAALVGLLGSIWATSERRFQFTRAAALALLGVAVLSLLLLALPATRPYLAGTLARLSYTDISVGEVLAEAEPLDQVRWDVFYSGLELWWRHQPLGMGYMNFMAWFEQNYGLEMPLHNSLQTWALEGGLPCLVIVVWIFVRYFRLLGLAAADGDPDEVRLAVALRWGMVAAVIAGLFHQAHQTPMTFGLIGMAYAFARRYRAPGYLIARAHLFPEPPPGVRPGVRA